jgi:hypothetical protein
MGCHCHEWGHIWGAICGAQRLELPLGGSSNAGVIDEAVSL